MAASRDVPFFWLKGITSEGRKARRPGLGYSAIMKPVTRNLTLLATWLGSGLAASVFWQVSTTSFAWWLLMGVPAALLLVVLLTVFLGSIAALIVAITHQPPSKPLG